MPVKVERTSLGKQIADLIRNDILYGRLVPGERISQQAICDNYGTSRMPVRDALRQLTYEGFLVDDGNGHALVAPLTQADISDVYLIEGMLHGLATRRVAERRDKDELTLLQNFHNGMLEAAAENANARMADLNWQFHREVNQLSRSRKLIAVLRRHSLVIPKDYLLQFPQWIDRANSQHEDILKLMWAGKGEASERRMRDHVVESGDDLIAYLGSLGMQLE